MTAQSLGPACAVLPGFMFVCAGPWLGGAWNTWPVLVVSLSALPRSQRVDPDSLPCVELHLHRPFVPYYFVSQLQHAPHIGHRIHRWPQPAHLINRMPSFVFNKFDFD